MMIALGYRKLLRVSSRNWINCENCPDKGTVLAL